MTAITVSSQEGFEEGIGCSKAEPDSMLQFSQKKWSAPHLAQTRRTHHVLAYRQARPNTSPLDRGWRLSLAKPGGRSSMSAGHRQRARMIKNRLRHRQKRVRADLKPRVEKSDWCVRFVSWF